MTTTEETETMTTTEAIEYVRSCDEDEGPESYEEARELFAAIFGRVDDGDQGSLWSHVCAAVGTDSEETETMTTDSNSNHRAHLADAGVWDEGNR